MLKITVIMPIYNAEKFLIRSVQSVLSQSYKNLELIMVDDGSKDNSLDICYQLSLNDNRIIVLTQNNMGSSVARNLGLSKATGDFVMFIDADDYIESNMISELVLSAKEKDADLVMCGLYNDYYDLNQKLVKSIKSNLRPRYIEGNKNIANDIIDLFENEKINGPTCKLIKSSLIKDNNVSMPVGIHLQEDLYFNVKILVHAESISVIKKSFYHYNHYMVESVTTRYYSEKLSMLNLVHNSVVEYFQPRTENPNLLSRIYYLYIKNVYAGFLNLFHPDCMMNRSEKLNFISQVISSPEFIFKTKKAKRNGLKYKLLKSILISRQKFLIYYFSKIIYWMKHRLKMKY